MKSNLSLRRVRPRRWQRATQRATSLCWGALRRNSIKAFWWPANNFGDQLTPLLLRHYGYTPVPTFQAANSEIVVVGSVLQEVSQDYSGCIVGAGLIDDRALPLPRARFLAVRGRLTAERVSAPATVPLGDPGLLSARIVRPAGRRHVLGIVPHYMDKEDPRLVRMSARLGKDAILIDVQRRPRAVLRDISRCEAVIASSLHGLVAADSYGIPSAWMVMSDRVLGQGFKFRDYFSSIGVAQDPILPTGEESLSDLIRATRSVPGAVAERADEFARIFEALPQTLSEVHEAGSAVATEL
jgi:pyruvyltransferase